MPERKGDNNRNQDERTIEDVLSEAEHKMGQSIEAMRRDISTLRTGRAPPSLIEDLTVDYYGTPTPLKQIAAISAPDARAIMVQPWDKQSLRDIERGLSQSDLGVQSVNDGNVITVPIPPLTQERRQEMVKLLKRKPKTARYPSATCVATAWIPCARWSGTRAFPKMKTGAVRNRSRKPPTPISRPLMR